MKRLALISTLFLLLGCSGPKTPSDTFRLHLFNEPQQLDPAQARSSSANYFFHNVLRGLYIFDNEKGVTPENGKCHWKNKKKLQCSLFKNFKWSNGQSVTAHDYQRAFLHLVNPTTGSPRSDLLISVKNASAILQGKKNPEKLGFNVLNNFLFDILFDSPDPEFIYKLTSSALFPKHKDNPLNRNDYKNFHSNGPYQIKNWKPEQSLLLTRNKHYPQGHPQRPDILFYIIDNDLTAFRLYESGQMDFLRRTLTQFVKKLKYRDDFHQIPQARFDYIGYGEPVNNSYELRKALALSIDYQASQKVLEALGPLGCPSIPSNWMDSQPCHEFNVLEARKAFAKVDPKILQKPLSFGFSLLGGSTLKRQAEFLQGQWKKNIGLSVEIKMMEQAMYLKILKTQPLSIFRKGVGLDRASCANALETFSKKSTQNFIEWNNEKYEEFILQLSTASSSKKRTILCRQAIDLLMKDFRIIPLGEIHFTVLARPKFIGWKLNQLNQLDLSQLHLSKP